MHCPICGNPHSGHETRCQSCGYSFETTKDQPMLSPGTLLQGKYRIDRVLGQGGFGITYAATQTLLDLKVAIKELFPAGAVRHSGTLQPPVTLDAAGWQQTRLDFMAEARILARFQHPDIVRVTDIFEEGGTVYLVMEHLEGETLQSKILRDGSLSPVVVDTIARRVLNALGVVHQAGMLHRDIKPENIFLEHSGRIVLIDFGSARDFISGKTVAHTRLVTPGYAPLEQYGKSAKFGPYTDLYALGATLYHALTGEAPPAATDRTMGEMLAPLPSHTPKALQQLVLTCMEVKVQDRPQSVQEVLRGLDQPQSAPAPAPPQKPAPEPVPAPVPPAKPPKNTGMFWMMALLLLGGGYFGYTRMQPPAGMEGQLPPEDSGASADTSPTVPEVEEQQVMLIHPQVSLYPTPDSDQEATTAPQGSLLPYTDETADGYQVRYQSSLYWVRKQDVLPVLGASALDQLVSELQEGGTVELQRGVYRLTRPIDLQQSVIITGQGKASTYLLSSASEDVLRSSGVQVHIDNLSILHTADVYARIMTASGGTVELQDVHFTGATRNENTQEFGSALWLKDGATATIDHSDLSGNAYGVYLSDTSTAEITSSTLNDNTLGGITYRDQSGGVLSDSTLSGNGVHGVHVMGQAAPQILDSIIQNNKERGISVYDEAQPSISNNTITGNGYQGIGVQNNATPVLKGNTIVQNQQSGITYFDAAAGKAEDNIVENNGKSGIAVTEEAQPELVLNSVRNNKEAGIAFSETAAGLASQNAISGNGNPGISAWGKAHPVVKGNRISQNQQSGMVFAETASGLISGNTIENNALYGIVVTDAASPQIMQNELLSNGKAGLFFKRKAQGFAIDNDCEGNPSGDIELDLTAGNSGPELNNDGCLVE